MHPHAFHYTKDNEGAHHFGSNSGDPLRSGARITIWEASIVSGEGHYGGQFHSLTLRDEATLWGRGNNRFGQVDAGIKEHLAPTKIIFGDF